VKPFTQRRAVGAVVVTLRVSPCVEVHACRDHCLPKKKGRMVQIDRSTPPHVIRAFRARLGQSQEALSADLGLGENAVYRYEQLGAPTWVRYALLGLAVCKHRVPVSEAEQLVGLKRRRSRAARAR